MNQYGEACAHHSSSEEEIFLTQDKLGYLICSSVSIDGKILGDVISAVHFCIIEDIL